MYNAYFERIIERSLKTFLRNQGLDHDAEESQNAYRIHCYMGRCLKTRCSVILNSNVAMLTNTPEIMFKFQKIEDKREFFHMFC